MNDELTNDQMGRQDFVDNLIYQTVLELSGKTEDELAWNIEYISSIREAIQEVIVDDLEIMSELEFYPYIEEI